MSENYTKVKRVLSEAADLIDAGDFRGADRKIRAATPLGITRADMDYCLGPVRMQSMLAWSRTALR